MTKIFYRFAVKMLVIFTGLSFMTGFFSVQAADMPEPAETTDAAAEKKLSDMVSFETIELCFLADGQKGEPVLDHTLIEKDRQLMLCYSYHITEEQSKNIEADTAYYLQVSPHLVLPQMESGEVLYIEIEDETETRREEFGTLYADGKKAWVIFKAGENGTVISDYEGLSGADFYLDCRRAENVPGGERPIEGESNLYLIKFENGETLVFGYAENDYMEPYLHAVAESVRGGWDNGRQFF